MNICMIGIDYNLADVSVREKFSFTRKESAAAMESIKKMQHIKGCIILSTCNRMELWCHTDSEFDGSLGEILASIKHVDWIRYKKYFVKRSGAMAAEHLFYLTCGLKSMILGEDQIITQVKDALSLAREYYCTDNVLEVLFRKAVTAAKEVKTEVVFSRADASAITQAVKKIKSRGFDFRDKKCMVIGNGEMGKLSALALLKEGADVTVTVREYKSGIVDIPRGCKRINYSDRRKMLENCELVVSATASPNYTIKKEFFDNMEKIKSLYLIDLAVPRDIEPEAGNIKGISLFDIDEFKAPDSEINRQAFVQADKILKNRMREFTEWYEGIDIIPRIAEIQTEAIEDLNGRLKKVLKDTVADRDKYDELLSGIDSAAGKVISKMMYCLRDNLEKDAFMECMTGLEKLYGEG